MGKGGVGGATTAPRRVFRRYRAIDPGAGQHYSGVVYTPKADHQVTRVNLHLSEEDGRALEELALRLGLSRQQLTKAAIKTYITQYATTLTRDATK